MLVLLKEHTLPTAARRWSPTATCAPATSTAGSARPTTRSGRPWPSTPTASAVLPNGSIGFRWGPDGRADAGKWNLEAREARHGAEVKLKLSVIEDGAQAHDIAEVAFPYFGGIETPHFTAQCPAPATINRARCRWSRLRAGQGRRGAPGAGRHRVRPAGRAIRHRPRPRQRRAQRLRRRRALHAGLAGIDHRRAARRRSSPSRAQFADNADKTHGKSMVIIGAAMNHWYHADMNYRGVINLLMMCGCIGQSGGGWAHYVGQEKLRPQTGLDCRSPSRSTGSGPPRQMNSTSFFYAHTDQWRYEKLGMDEIVSPLRRPTKLYGGSMIDYNVRAERMGWLPSAPQLKTNPAAGRQGRDRSRHGPQGLRGQGAAGRHAADELRGPGRTAELATQPVRLALQPAGLQRQGPRVFPASTCSAPATACRARTSAATTPGPRKSSGTTRRRRASSTCW